MPREIVSAPAVRAFFTSLLARLNRESTGGATTIADCACWMLPPSLDLGEITDKGSINQRAVLTHRAELVDAMHGPRGSDPLVIYALAIGPDMSTSCVAPLRDSVS